MAFPAVINPHWAVFLDVDGTLLDIADTPHAVVVPEVLPGTLHQLQQRLGGALALISGRSIQTLDALFAPLQLPAAGIHGNERRTAQGALLYPAIDAQLLLQAQQLLAAFAATHEGLLLEDKGHALALHFRLAPQLQPQVEQIMQSTQALLGAAFTLQAGKSVLELRPSGADKGQAVRAFMQEAPFAGRTPLYVGDDVTDEAAFEQVNLMQGLSIRVGSPAPTLALHRLDTVAAVHAWLQRIPPIDTGPLSLA
jgi:trehalose 6-phosphate phosphatase